MVTALRLAGGCKNPYINASVGSNWVQGREWEQWRTELTLTLDDPKTDQNPDYGTTATVEHNPDNAGRSE